jgi:hypothetical protein
VLLRGLSDNSESIEQFRVENKEEKKDYDRKYNLQNKYKRSEYKLYYRAEHVDRKKLYNEQYHLQHNDKEIESKRRYRLENKDRKREYFRRYNYLNKDKIRDSNRQYRVEHHSNPEIYLPRNIESKSWKSPELVREYFESIAKQLNISNFSDWYRISRMQVIELEGTTTRSTFVISFFLLCFCNEFSNLHIGRTLFSRFETLGSALQYAYPEFDWDLSKFSLRGKKSEQRWLKVNVEELLPGIETIEDFQHSKLLWGVNLSRIFYFNFYLFLYLLRFASIRSVCLFD